MNTTINSAAAILDRLETTGEIRLRLQPRVFSPALLRTARRSAGIVQRAMADAVGRDLRHYRRIESGDVNPTAELLGRFAAVLDVTIDSLYAIPEEEASVRSDG